MQLTQSPTELHVVHSSGFTADPQHVPAMHEKLLHWLAAAQAEPSASDDTGSAHANEVSSEQNRAPPPAPWQQCCAPLHVIAPHCRPLPGHVPLSGAQTGDASAFAPQHFWPTPQAPSPHSTPAMGAHDAFTERPTAAAQALVFEMEPSNPTHDEQYPGAYAAVRHTDVSASSHAAALKSCPGKHTGQVDETTATLRCEGHVAFPGAHA